VTRFRDHYRPELHYMRGPGPKWHAKHTASLVSAAGAQRSLRLSAEPAAKARYLPPLAAWIVSTAAAALLGFVVVMIFA
jgi:hypothetical protein